MNNSIWDGEILIPDLPERRFKVGHNIITQNTFVCTKARVKIFESEHAGHYLAFTEMRGPLKKILIRKKGARRVNSELLVLYCPDINDTLNVLESTRLSWDSTEAIQNYLVSPEKVILNWTGKFSFHEENQELGLPGLRPPQIGALHALCAHFAVGKHFEPATVVLPTGTGKTETMLALLLYRKLQRTLVLVPNDPLRTQISDKFAKLGILPLAKVVPDDIARPFVAKISSGIRSIEEAEQILARSNVIVALPQTLQVSCPEAVSYLIEGCTDLIVDEAHHVSAQTWSGIKEKFRKKRIVQFTATPFRQDNKRIDGEIIFNYKLGDAQEAGYYKPINLKAIEEFGDSIERDRRIAVEAISVLKRDCEELSLDHLLMARAKNIPRARKILEIYKSIAPEYNPQIVFSGSGRSKTNREALNKILDRSNNGSRIIVCVDMLGEGFDLPNLKIAALHDMHKSLAITLQFIGRFTRKGDPDKIGEATVVTNVADPEVEKKLTDLYAEGADWDILIKRLSEEKIQEELDLQDMVQELRQNGDLHANLSLWNLTPSLTVQIYRTKCLNWEPLNYKDALSTGSESWYAISEKDKILVAVVHRNEKVGWGSYQNLYQSFYDLVLVHWLSSENALFVYSSDYKGLRIENMATRITNEDTEVLSGPAIFNILNNVELPLVKNLGSSRIGAISFTSYFGPNVTEGLASIEKTEAELNNIACLGYENGDRVLWGGSQKNGKIWQRTSSSISQWVQWCANTWQKVSNEEDIDSGNITRDFLRPKKLNKLHASWPISIQWGEQIQMDVGNRDKGFVLFNEIEVPLYLVDLCIVEFIEDESITFRVESEDYFADFKLQISEQYTGGYAYSKIAGPNLYIKRNRKDAIPLDEYVVRDPLIIRYADGTYSYNCYHVPINLDSGVFPKDRLEVWDWGQVPLNKESIGKNSLTDTIQYKTFEVIKDEYDLIFNDDGKGEAADLVALKDIDEENIRLSLIHCKGAIGAKVSNRIENFYTVCGQAQKSISIKHAGINSLYYDLKRRHDQWVREGGSRFLKGDIKLLSFFKEKSRKTKLDFEIWIVQPGGSAKSITDDILKLLGTTDLFVVKTAKANFRVIVSE